MRSQTIQCDQCGKSKGKSNDWWFLQTSDQYEITLSNKDPDVGEFLDLCGQECVLAKVSLLMNAAVTNVKLQKDQKYSSSSSGRRPSPEGQNEDTVCKDVRGYYG